jgi:hypothetical protein
MIPIPSGVRVWIATVQMRDYLVPGHEFQLTFFLRAPPQTTQGGLRRSDTLQLAASLYV